MLCLKLVLPFPWHIPYKDLSALILTAIRVRLQRNKLYSYSIDMRKNEGYKELRD